jgi:hypothetical protein
MQANRGKVLRRENTGEDAVHIPHHHHLQRIAFLEIVG